MPDDLITTTDLVNFSGRGDPEDPGLGFAVLGACDMVRTMTEQTFTAGTSTVTLDGTGTDAIFLPERPVLAAGTVTVEGSAVTDYVVGPYGALLRKADDEEVTYTTLTWPAGRQNVVVTYEHGYTDAPNDIRQVALSIANRLITQGPAIQEQLGEVGVRYGTNASDFTKGELMIMRKYRRIQVFASRLVYTPGAPLRGLMWLALTDVGHVEARTSTSDTGGGATETWEPGYDVACRVDPLGGSEALSAERIDSRTTHVITTPPDTNARPADRFVVNDRGTYEITAVRDRTGRAAQIFEAVEAD